MKRGSNGSSRKRATGSPSVTNGALKRRVATKSAVEPAPVLPVIVDERLEQTDALEDAEVAAREKQRQRAEALQQLVVLESRLAGAREREAAARLRREQLEHGMGGYRAAAAFAAAARADAERSGDRDRVLQEKMVEERAAYETAIFQSRLTAERDEENRFRAEREELEGLTEAERRKEATLARECDATATLVAMARVKASLEHNCAPAPPAVTNLPPPTAIASPVEVPELVTAHSTSVMNSVDSEAERKRHLRAEVVELREAENEATRRRIEAERMLATLGEPPIAEAAAHVEAPRMVEAPRFVPPPRVEPSEPAHEPKPESSETAETIAAVASALLDMFAPRAKTT